MKEKKIEELILELSNELGEGSEKYIRLGITAYKRSMHERMQCKRRNHANEQGIPYEADLVREINAAYDREADRLVSIRTYLCANCGFQYEERDEPSPNQNMDFEF